MKKYIAEFVAKCQNFQQVKYEHQRPTGFLQRMPIPEWKWEMIVMDFVVSLPKTLGKYEEEPVAIFDRDVQKLRTKEIKSMKVQLKYRPVEKATWETEKDIRDKDP